jgi:hypothetical protein
LTDWWNRTSVPSCSRTELRKRYQRQQQRRGAAEAALDRLLAE